MRNPFRYFNSSPEVIRLAVMLYIRYPPTLRHHSSDADQRWAPGRSQGNATGTYAAPPAHVLLDVWEDAENITNR